MAHTEGKPARGSAGYPLKMIRENMDTIPDWPIPDGYRFGTMRQDDIGLWVDIERDAEPYFTVGHGMFYSTFGSDLQEICARCFILYDERGCGVGTASAWFNPDVGGSPIGQVHWVAVREGWKGRGLGKGLLSHVLKELEKGYRGAYLETQSERIGAVSLYLSAGFVPYINDVAGRIGWAEVAGRFDHPVLTDIGRFERPVR